MHLIDTHAHLYSEEFEQDIATIVERASRQNVKQIYLPAIDSLSHEKLIALSDQYPDMMRPMMGLHPCSVTENSQIELDMAHAHLQNRKDWVAVGEIGLDFYWDTTYKTQQIAAFRTQIEWAIEANLPIVIHSRKSTYECIDILKDYKGKLRGIFHCFSGSIEEAKEVVKLDFLLGIGGVVTYKNAGLKNVLPAIGLAHLVLETDAPYLTPVPYRGKRNESSYIRLIADEIAQIMQVGVSAVADKTTENALVLFKR